LGHLGGLTNQCSASATTGSRRFLRWSPYAVLRRAVRVLPRCPASHRRSPNDREAGRVLSSRPFVGCVFGRSVPPTEPTPCPLPMAWLAPTYQETQRDLDSTLPCYCARQGASPFCTVAGGWVKACASGHTGPLRNMKPNTSPPVRADDPPSSAKRHSPTSTAPYRAQYGIAWPARSPGQSGAHSIGGPEAEALGRTEEPPPTPPATTAERTAPGPVPVGAGSRPVVPAAVWLPGAGGPPPPRPAPPARFALSVDDEPPIEKRFLLL